MTADSCSWRWQSSIAIALVLSGSAVCASGRMVSAQMIPDHTLGAESSVVKPDTIQGMESDRIPSEFFSNIVKHRINLPNHI